MDNLERNSIYGLAVIVVLYHISNPCKMRLYFGVVSFGVCMLVFKKFEESLLVSLVIALSSDLYKRYVREPFEGFKEEIEETNNDLEKFKEEMEEKDDYINITETYKENVKNLDIETLEKMTSQTEKFMEQQGKLIGVMENLGPTLKQGMEMLQTFSNFKEKLN